jgi:hypothetical protein
MFSALEYACLPFLTLLVSNVVSLISLEAIAA